MEEDASVETLLSPIPEEAKAAMGKHGEEVGQGLGAHGPLLLHYHACPVARPR